MEYTFDNVTEIIDNASIRGYSCQVEENPLPILQGVFDDMKKEYIRARNVTTEMFISDYGEEEGKTLMTERYPMPINIDELANQAKIIANKYEICGTTLVGKRPGFIVKIPNVRVRVRTYCNLGDYYCWIQKYGIDKLELKIYQAMPNEEGYLIFGGAAYPHPHIAGHNPCLGSFDGVIRNCAGHFNMVGVLSNIKTYLNAYYGRSVYLRHSEFRPYYIHSLPIKLLKKYPGVSINFDSYFNESFRDEPGLAPEYGSKDYENVRNSYVKKYDDNIEKIELKPHEGNFYIQTYNWNNDLSPYFSEIVQKNRLISDRFNIEFYQAYALLINHGKQLNGTPIQFDKKYHEYEEAWTNIRDICIDLRNLVFKVGYENSIVRIKPDETLNQAGNLEREAYNIYQLLYPRENDGIRRMKDMPCDKFWKYIDNFKDIEEFLIPQDNYDERKEEAILRIDEIYPKVMEYRDAFSRKILLTIDKHKRRLQNGLKHTIPTPESNQLSLETLSQD